MEDGLSLGLLPYTHGAEQMEFDTPGFRLAQPPQTMVAICRGNQQKQDLGLSPAIFRTLPFQVK